MGLFRTSPRVKHYKKLRKTGKYLNQDILQTLSKKAILDCAKKMNIFKENKLLFCNQSELPVLFDYCIYSHRHKGKNALEKYIENSPPPPESDKMIILQAMLKSYYSIFET